MAARIRAALCCTLLPWALTGCGQLLDSDDLRFDCDQLAGKSDNFNLDGSPSDDWFLLDGSGGQEAPRVKDGELQLTPHASSYWEGQVRGTLLFKLVCGNFTVAAKIESLRPDENQPPGSPYNGGGLMVRNPAAEPFEEWVHQQRRRHTSGYLPRKHGRARGAR